MPSIIETLEAELQVAEHDLTLPHILDGRIRDIEKRLEDARNTVKGIEDELYSTQMYRQNLPDTIEKLKERIRVAKQLEGKRTELGLMHKAEAILDKLKMSPEEFLKLVEKMESLKEVK